MDLTNTVLGDVKEGLGLPVEDTAFDTELLMHINSSVVDLSQNGVTLPIIVNAETTWVGLQDPTQTEGNKIFQSVPLYVMLNTKILFDPPPPSSVEHHANQIQKLLWRLKLAYE